MRSIFRDLLSCLLISVILLFSHLTPLCDANPVLVGACCLPYCECYELEFEEDCVAEGGIWLGYDYICGYNAECPECIGACCIIETRHCYLLDEETCDAMGGFITGAECDIELCPPLEILSPCCAGNQCAMGTRESCEDFGGLWLPEHESCQPYMCLPDSLSLAGGCIIAHDPGGIAYSYGSDWNDRYWTEFALEDCSELDTELSLSDEAQVWYVLFAFSHEATTCGVQFGFGDYDPECWAFVDWGTCPGSSPMVIPTDGWPGPNEGVAIVATDEQWTGAINPVAWFAGYAYAVGEIPISVEPSQDFAGFGNCQAPASVFAAASFGSMGLGQPGVACSPETFEAVCCINTDCRILSIYECTMAGGFWFGDNESCDPEPCALADVTEPEMILPVFGLITANPNPFTNRIELRFENERLKSGSPVTMKICDATGAVVRTIHSDQAPAGSVVFQWDGFDDRGRLAPAGTYFCQAVAGEVRATGRIVLLR
jgi:FlgD Ig-like domain